MRGKIEDIIRERVLVLDGAMGTMVQKYGLSENDFRGERFRNSGVLLRGNNEVLNITRPDIIAAIHRQYLEAGADIIETNTFNAQRISQSEYGLEMYAPEMNRCAARIARSEADRMTSLHPDRPRFVAGSVGPTGKTASISPDVENPAYRSIDFDTLVEAYSEQMEVLVSEGADILLIETIFDTLNAKAALEASEIAFEKTGIRLPVCLSVTIADASGRTLSGQTMEAFLASVSHAAPFAVGLNCSFGAEQMFPFLKDLSRTSPFYTLAYPNAGLPNISGEYDQKPDDMAADIARFIKNGLVNIAGGCCGSTPEHTAAIARSAISLSGSFPTRNPDKGHIPWLCGLDAFRNENMFINIGERCNVAGSRKFLRLIKEAKYEEALGIAREQVRNGAMILDVNMDDGMIDGKREMVNFLNLMASDPEVAAIPWMVDSSRFDIVEAALKTIQGKAVVNSISLKEGESTFLERAVRIKELGAAVVVMAFDENGQATDYESKIRICSRAYRLLTEKAGFNPEDIIFDPNVLTVATGMAEHDRYALDFIEAVRWIHGNLPGAKTSGGISNLSFAFRGNNYLREAMHSVFLFHAINAGLDMGIVNPSSSVMFEDIPEELRSAIEDVILCRKADATEKLIGIAEKYRTISNPAQETASESDRSAVGVDERLQISLKHGDDACLESDLMEALGKYGSASLVIGKPLMQGMSEVGRLFGDGKMFLPQVVKSARIMKKAVDILKPYISAEGHERSANKAGKYLLATVKGDVHDIGKNIVSVILSCNNFEIIDLGVMVTADRIIEAARKSEVDFIGLSGLITPSLEEMCHIASELKTAGINVPLFIGGATTSDLHTALKIAPLYDGPVFHVKDAAQNPVIASSLKSPDREKIINSLKLKQERMRNEYFASVSGKKKDGTGSAAGTRINIDWNSERLFAPKHPGSTRFERIEIGDLVPYINWSYFHHFWKVRPDSKEGNEIKEDAMRSIKNFSGKYFMKGIAGIFPAYGTDKAIIADGHVEIKTPRQNKPGDDGLCLSLCDFIAPLGYGDHIGCFAVTICRELQEKIETLKKAREDYEALLFQSLSDRLVEAAAEWMHAVVRKEIWGYEDEFFSAEDIMMGKYRGIRPAIGYPSLPLQSAIFKVNKLIDLSSIGISLTENGAMYPQSSVCGLYLASGHARYFNAL